MFQVYIETTVPSAYHDTRTDVEMAARREATRRWWRVERPAYHLVTSRYTLLELEDAPEPKRSLAIEMLRGVEVLEELPGHDQLVSMYIENFVMPADRVGDAAHVAIATMHRIPYLLTWNIKHLANIRKTEHLAALNGRVNLPTPRIVTPSLLTEHFDDEEE